jgi:hypothetical protein
MQMVAGKSARTATTSLRIAALALMLALAPQYSITISEWKTGDEVGSKDFSFKNATSATKKDLADLPNMDELPQIFAVGGRK